MNNKEDIEFLARMNAINSFKSSLRSLLKMYDFGVHESHNYGNNEEYVKNPRICRTTRSETNQ